MTPPRTARAHVLARYGKRTDVLAFEARPAPPLAPDEVRIEVEAVALNPVDLKAMEGEPRMLLPFAPPFVPGSDLAGTVAEVGPAVEDLRPGDPVLAFAGMDRMGAFAEVVTLPARRVGRRPRGMDAVEAACLPLPGLAALAALDAGGVRPGSRVLIHGGAGGVGALAVQLASQRGAEVHATVGAADLERVRALGARRPIDRDAERFEDVARDLDLVLDTVGGETQTRSFAALRRGGTLASLHVPPPADALIAAGLRAPWFLRTLLPLVTLAPRRAAARAGVRLAPILTVPEPGALARLARAAEDPGLRVTIARVFPFEALGDAVEHLRSGAARGRVVLRRG